MFMDNDTEGLNLTIFIIRAAPTNGQDQTGQHAVTNLVGSPTDFLQHRQELTNS